MVTNNVPSTRQTSASLSGPTTSRPISPALKDNKMNHYRRFSAPWVNKKCEEFGTDYDKMYGSPTYWKINGNPRLREQSLLNSGSTDSGNKRRDSTELNMLQMIKEDPEMHGIYRYISKQSPDRHTRSQSVIQYVASIISIVSIVSIDSICCEFIQLNPFNISNIF